MADARRDSAVPLAVRALPDRGRVVCRGFIESVTYVPAVRVAAFTAILVDHDARAGTKKSAAAAARAGLATGVVPAVSSPKGRASVRSGIPRPKDRLRVIWLGRRRIRGVNAGTELRLEGMVTLRDGLPTMFNPRYEILSGQEDL
ncbi:hypothetical protein [Arthrobacter sp. PAMC25284]|uniref:hypothetical protein n=1 Tax=Arthrobacter sp. PAMC25284 TaxID=2861279 RepID=UPI001C632603|nr:hypothetical protein [Arthrobacter sp. PAMC25284]QYF90574.1 hypothetical protein KY499_04580 [Arthrobacter sp. PAMC25284]